jgi:hypothetical protein
MKNLNIFKQFLVGASLSLAAVACTSQYLPAVPNAQLKLLNVTLISGTVSVSSEPYGGFSKANLTDNNASTPWSSQLYSSANNTEWVSYRFAAATQTNFVKLETRFFAPQSRALGFPVNFRILALDTNIVLATYTNYTVPNTNAAVTLSFPTANVTGVKIEATQLGAEDNNSYVFQLSELSVGNDTGTSGVISVSSEPYGGFSKANLTDNNVSTAWSSQLYSSANNTEWVSYRFAAATPVNFVKLETRFFTPQSRALGFPVNFRILALDTNTVLATYTNYTVPNTNAAVTLSFPVATVTGVKIEATQLGTEDNNNFVFQLSELSTGNNAGTLGTVSVSSEPYAGFSKANLIDNNTSTPWSSQLHPSATNTERVDYRFNSATQTNFVKLETRFSTPLNRALGFPVDFRILALDTGTVLRTFTNFPTPNSAQPIILSFPSSSIAGVRIEATKLGTEDNSNFVFQLNEVSAGNNPSYDTFVHLGTNTDANLFEVRNIGSGAFNPNRMSNWVFDQRRPLITANNIYAPSIVKNNGAWNIYFGGWNDSNQNDKVYLLNSQDDFLTFQNPTGPLTESINYRFSAATPVSSVRLETRFLSSLNRALGFPVNFRILALDTNTVLATYTNYPTPTTNAAIALSFATTTVNGIRIEASELGTDDSNNYSFQLSELSVGNSTTATIAGTVSVSSEPFSGFNKSNLTDGNVNTAWSSKLYATPLSTSTSLGTTVIQQGVFVHTNNESVIKVGPNDWRMLLTTYPVANQNKPMYATSSDGINFTPNAGTLSNNITMTGYPNWAGADVNGGNVLYFENGVYHMYFVDFNNFAVHHATSTDFVNYTYQGVALNEVRVINDFKRFNFGGTVYYMAVTHVNRDSIRASVGTSLNTLPASQVLFSSKDAKDPNITSVGLVTDGNRLLGAIYGASDRISLDTNRLFAVWLQKKVLFTNANITWGEGGSSFGPDRFKVSMTQPVQTGQFKILDTDGTTLLTQSPDFTVVQGDIWDYRP